jgi:hypothetical protein
MVTSFSKRFLSSIIRVILPSAISRSDRRLLRSSSVSVRRLKADEMFDFSKHKLLSV